MPAQFQVLSATITSKVGKFTQGMRRAAGAVKALGDQWADTKQKFTGVISNKLEKLAQTIPPAATAFRDLKDSMRGLTTMAGNIASRLEGIANNAPLAAAQMEALKEVIQKTHRTFSTSAEKIRNLGAAIKENNRTFGALAGKFERIAPASEQISNALSGMSETPSQVASAMEKLNTQLEKTASNIKPVAEGAGQLMTAWKQGRNVPKKIRETGEAMKVFIKSVKGSSRTISSVGTAMGNAAPKIVEFFGSWKGIKTLPDKMRDIVGALAEAVDPITKVSRKFGTFAKKTQGAYQAFNTFKNGITRTKFTGTRLDEIGEALDRFGAKLTAFVPAITSVWAPLASFLSLVDRKSVTIIKSLASAFRDAANGFESFKKKWVKSQIRAKVDEQSRVIYLLSAAVAHLARKMRDLLPVLYQVHDLLSKRIIGSMVVVSNKVRSSSTELKNLATAWKTVNTATNQAAAATSRAANTQKKAASGLKTTFQKTQQVIKTVESLADKKIFSRLAGGASFFGRAMDKLRSKMFRFFVTAMKQSKAQGASHAANVVKLQRMANVMKGLHNATNLLGRAIRMSFAPLPKLGKAFMRLARYSIPAAVTGVQALGMALKRTLEHARRLSSALSMLSTSLLMVSGLMSTVVAATAGAAVREYANFEDVIAKIIGLTDLGQERIEPYIERILELSTLLPQTPTELATGLYFVGSQGLRGAEALDVLTQAAKGAVAQLGDIETIARLLTSAMIDYGNSGLTAARALNVLTAAVREGALEASEMAPVLGELLPMASALGVSFEDMAGLLAVLSRTGMNARVAATGIKSAFMALTKSFQKGSKVLKAVGISYAQLRELLRQPGGIIEVFRILQTALRNNMELMTRAIPNRRALRAVLGVLSQEASEVNRVMNAVWSSADSVNGAVEAASNTIRSKLKLAFDEMRVAAVVAVGQARPQIAKLLDELKVLFKAIRPSVIVNLRKAIIGTVGALRNMVKWVWMNRESLSQFFDTFGNVLKLLGRFMSEHPKLLAALISLQMFGFVGMTGAVTALGSALSDVLVIALGGTIRAARGLSSTIRMFGNVVKGVFGSVSLLTGGLVGLSAVLAGAIIANLDTITEWFSKGGIGQTVSEVKDALWKLIGYFRDEVLPETVAFLAKIWENVKSFIDYFLIPLWKDVFKPLLDELWKTIKDDFYPILKELAVVIVKNLIPAIYALLDLLKILLETWSGALITQLKFAVGVLKYTVIPALNGIAAIIKHVLIPLLRALGKLLEKVTETAEMFGITVSREEKERGKQLDARLRKIREVLKAEGLLAEGPEEKAKKKRSKEELEREWQQRQDELTRLAQEQFKRRDVPSGFDFGPGKGPLGGGRPPLPESDEIDTETFLQQAQVREKLLGFADQLQELADTGNLSQQSVLSFSQDLSRLVQEFKDGSLTAEELNQKMSEFENAIKEVVELERMRRIAAKKGTQEDIQWLREQYRIKVQQMEKERPQNQMTAIIESKIPEIRQKAAQWLAEMGSYLLEMKEQGKLTSDQLLGFKQELNGLWKSFKEGELSQRDLTDALNEMKNAANEAAEATRRELEQKRREVMLRLMMGKATKEDIAFLKAQARQKRQELFTQRLDQSFESLVSRMAGFGGQITRANKGLRGFRESLRLSQRMMNPFGRRGGGGAKGLLAAQNPLVSMINLLLAEVLKIRTNIIFMRKARDRIRAFQAIQQIQMLIQRLWTRPPVFNALRLQPAVGGPIEVNVVRDETKLKRDSDAPLTINIHTAAIDGRRIMREIELELQRRGRRI